MTGCKTVTCRCYGTIAMFLFLYFDRKGWKGKRGIEEKVRKGEKAEGEGRMNPCCKTLHTQLCVPAVFICCSCDCCNSLILKANVCCFDFCKTITVIYMRHCHYCRFFRSIMKLCCVQLPMLALSHKPVDRLT